MYMVILGYSPHQIGISLNTTTNVTQGYSNALLGLSPFQTGISFNPIHSFCDKHPQSMSCIIWVHLHYPPHPCPQLPHSTSTITQLPISSHPNSSTSVTHKLYNYAIHAILHFLTLLQMNVVIHCSSST